MCVVPHKGDGGKGGGDKDNNGAFDPDYVSYTLLNSFEQFCLILPRYFFQAKKYCDGKGGTLNSEGVCMIKLPSKGDKNSVSVTFSISKYAVFSKLRLWGYIPYLYRYM